MKKNETGNSKPKETTRNTAHGWGHIMPLTVFADAIKPMSGVLNIIKDIFPTTLTTEQIMELYDDIFINTLTTLDMEEQFTPDQMRRILRRVEYLKMTYDKATDKEALLKDWRGKIDNVVFSESPCIKNMVDACIYEMAIKAISDAPKRDSDDNTNKPPKTQQGANTGQISHTISNDDKKKFSEMFKPAFRGMGGGFNQFEILCADMERIASNKDFAAVCAMIHNSKMKNGNMPKKFTDFYRKMCGFFNYDPYKSYYRKGNLSDNISRLKNEKFTYL